MSRDFLSFGECAEQFRKFVRPEDTDGTCYIGLEHIEQGTLHLNSFGTAKEVTSAKASPMIEFQLRNSM